MNALLLIPRAVYDYLNSEAFIDVGEVILCLTNNTP